MGKVHGDIKNTKGNAYAIKEYDCMNQPIKMHILNPDFVTPVIEKIQRICITKSEMKMV